MLKYGDVILLIRPQVWKVAIAILHTVTKIKKKETIKIFLVYWPIIFKECTELYK